MFDHLTASTLVQALSLLEAILPGWRWKVGISQHTFRITVYPDVRGKDSVLTEYDTFCRGFTSVLSSVVHNKSIYVNTLSVIESAKTEMNRCYSMPDSYTCLERLRKLAGTYSCETPTVSQEGDFHPDSIWKGHLNRLDNTELVNAIDLLFRRDGVEKVSLECNSTYSEVSLEVEGFPEKIRTLSTKNHTLLDTLNLMR